MVSKDNSVLIVVKMYQGFIESQASVDKSYVANLG